MSKSKKIVMICPKLRKPEVWVEALQKEDPSLQVEIYPNDTERENTEFIYVWNAPMGVYKKYPNLKVIASLAAGIDHLFKDPTLPKNVTITRTNNSVQKRDIAVFVLGLVLRKLRRFDRYEQQQTKKKWAPHGYEKPKNTGIGIMGLGNIGSEIARLMVQNGFSVSGWSRSEKTIKGVQSFYGEDKKSAFLKTADILVSVLPLTDATRGILNRQTFQKLPPKAYLINIGRGEHLVEDDLEEAIQTGQISGAALDVFREEPLPETHSFWENDKIFITPHVANTIVPQSVAKKVVANYNHMQKGTPLGDTVNVSQGY